MTMGVRVVHGAAVWTGIRTAATLAHGYRWGIVSSRPR